MTSSTFPGPPVRHCITAPIDMTRMAESILDPLMAEKGDRAVEITVSPGAHAIADEGLILLVLENLIGNAWKYSSKRNPSKIEFGFREAADEVSFSFRTTAWASTPTTLTGCSGRSSAFTPTLTFPEPESAWPPCSASSRAMAEGFGRKQPSTREQNSASACPTSHPEKARAKMRPAGNPSANNTHQKF